MFTVTFKHLSTAFISATLSLSMSVAHAQGAQCAYTGPGAPMAGELLKQVRVMTMNVWGQNDDSEGKCQARLNAIGQRVASAQPLYDIIGMTEVHPDYAAVTCDGQSLVSGLQINGEYTGDKARWGHPETSWKEYDGGVSLFSRTPFRWNPYSRHVHRFTPNLNPRTAHGFVFSQIKVAGGFTIDVYVVHINSTGSGSIISPKCDRNCKRRELGQLAYGIHQRSATSGNPVLVMGDFNIGGLTRRANQCRGNAGYSDIMDMLRNPRDVWLEAHPNKAGSTHGDQRIDFMFLLDDPYFTNSQFQLSIANPDSVRLLDWTMPGYNRGFPRGWVNGPFKLSDHLGFEATLQIRRRVSLPAILTAID